MSGSPAGALLGRLDEALAANGLMTRGVTRDGGQTIVLVGHAGSSIWPPFTRWRAGAAPARIRWIAGRAP